MVPRIICLQFDLGTSVSSRRVLGVLWEEHIYFMQNSKIHCPHQAEREKTGIGSNLIANITLDSSSLHCG